MTRTADPRHHAGTPVDADHTGEPDVMELYTQWIIAITPPELHATIAEQKANFCQQFGGQRYFLPKGTKRTLTPEQRQAVFNDGLTTMDNETIIQKHKISRRTLYRVMKGGGGRFG